MTARAALATSAIMAGTVTAHSWAGGELPPFGWTALVGAIVFAATRAVFRGRVGARVMVVGLAAAQFGVHALLTALAAQPSHHLGATHHAGSAAHVDVLSMSWQMAIAHVLSAVLTVWVWTATASSLEDIARLPDRPHLAVRARRAGPVSQMAPVFRTVAGWRSGAPRRGPPPARSLQYA